MFLTESDKRIYTGEDLRAIVSEAQGLKKRDCYSELQKYLNHPRTSMVFSFCGLKGTGKSTMMTQAICDMDLEHFKQTCFILGNKYESMDELASDMYRLYRGDNKYKYFFVHEITAIPDFIRRSAWMSDLFCKMGNRVVITGTDSLSLIMAGADHLYDRQDLIHTSYIPYHEFRRIIGDSVDNEGNKGIDLYISYGGTLVPESKDGNPNFSKSPFATTKAIGEYINTAISGNILHSIQQDDSIRYKHSPLRELDRKGRLQNVINRFVAYLNETITLKSLDAAHHLSLPNMQLLYELFFAKQPVDKVGDNQFYDIEFLAEPIRSITKDYLNSLHITESIGKGITQAQIEEIGSFLSDIGLLREVEVKIYTIARNQTGERQIDGLNGSSYNKHLVITQPGMQYCIANALVDAMVLHSDKLVDAVNIKRQALGMNKLSDEKLNNVEQRIRDKVRGSILETIVLVEAADAAKKIDSKFKVRRTAIDVQTYKLEFKINEMKELNGTTKTSCTQGEVDLVVEDRRDKQSCSKLFLFEVKHSDFNRNKQFENLLHPDLRWIVEDHYGKQIVQRTVLYRGPSKVLSNGVIYYNVEDFLCKIGEDPNFLVCDLKEEIMKEEQSKAQVQALAQTLEMDDQTQELEQEPKEDINNDDIDQCQYDATDWCER